MAEGRVDLKVAGAKFDGDKVRWELIPYDALEKVAEVYTLGAKKYATDNWALGISYRRIIGALLRHLFKWMVLGEKYDKDNGQHHLASVVWNGLTLLAYEVRGMNGGEFDDRPISQEKKVAQ